MGNKAFSVNDVSDGGASLAPAAPPRRKIIVEEGHLESDPPYVDVGVQGVMHRVNRGVEVEVPQGVVNVLKDAVIDRTIHLPEGGMTTRPARRFPFQDLGPAA